MTKPGPPDRDPNDPDRTVSSDQRTISSGGGGDARTGAPLPDSIGDYRILGKLGEGGMGVVYEAEQQNPKRKVALKVVRGGALVDETSVRMFQREVETLGRLKHPGIGAIHEAGRTDEGRHFFAMELVRGETLDAYLRKREGDGPLSRGELRRRLDLFRRICDAVSYAHQRGVVHRDLKPSNIVVGEDGQPKILDFGLARITDSDTAAASMVSEIGTIKGTLPYMSPEQARGNPFDIDLRTDIYSLGIILYEMIAGGLPYDTADGSIMEAIRVINEVEPARFRDAGPPAGRLAGGELETIVRKALEKDPDRRYQSVAGLSNDVERYLTDQPILARPPSTLYQIRKLIARNRLPFAFAGALGVLLVAFAAVATIQAGIVARERDRAEDEAGRATAMNDFMREMLTSVDPWSGGEVDRTMADALEGAIAQLDSGKFAGRPLLEAEIRNLIGSSLFALGRRPDAEKQTRISLDLRKAALGPDDPALAESWEGIAANAQSNREYDKAVDACREQVRLLEKRTGGPDQDLIDAYDRLGNSLSFGGRFEEADSVAGIMERAAAGLGRDSLKYLASAAALRGDIAQRRTSDFVAADSEYSDALRLYREYDSTSLSIPLTLSNLATVRMYRGDLESAAGLLQEALALDEKTIGTDHPSYALRLENLANVLYQQKEYDRSLAALQKVLEIRRKNLGDDNILVARSMANMAAIAGATKPIDEALPMYDRTLAAFRKAYGEDHYEIAQVLRNKAGSLRQNGRYGECDSLYREAIAMFIRTLGDDHLETAKTKAKYGRSLVEQERWREGEEQLAAAFPAILASYGEEHSRTRETAENLVKAYEGMGRPDDAEMYRPYSGAGD